MISDKIRVALVTGVSSGIGRATATFLANSGYRVYGTVRTVKPESEISGVILLQMDVKDEKSVLAAVQSILDSEKHIDDLINNAGIGVSGCVEETEIGLAQELFETNFFGMARVTKAVLPSMRERRSGRIVNISSIAGFLPFPFMGYYSASKHAVEGFTESLDHEVRPFGIRAVTVEPGFTRTKVAQNSRTAEATVPDYEENRTQIEKITMVMVDKGVDPEEVAKVVLTAMQATRPRHRYIVGKEGKKLERLRTFLPEEMFDKGFRKNFGLKG